MISQDKKEALDARMARLGIFEDDLVEKFVLGSGNGGQKINKTHSCVYLKHEPSGVEVKCQESRSQTTNRFLARTELCDRIEESERAAAERRKQRREKAKRRNRGRPAGVKRRILENKRRRGEVKRNRRKVTD